MTRSSVGRESRAAYAASQPLFEALQHATARLGEQTAHLAKSRDTVQHTHVKLAQQHDDHSDDHATYLTAAVSAWASATATYRDLFRAMADITAADPTQGRPAAGGHDALRRMAASAQRATELATSFRLPPSPSPLSGPSPGAKRAAGPHEQSTKRTRLPSAAAGRRDGDAWVANAHRETLAPAAQPLVARGKRISPVGESGAVEPRRKRRAVTGSERRDDARVPHPKSPPPPTPQTVGAGQENHVPGIEYEDLTADVEARLHAKADKKKARKQQLKEKKRKRESADSNAPDLAGFLARAEKPAKKRTRAEADTPPTPHGKRKTDLPADMHDGGETRKKRKKRHV